MLCTHPEREMRGRAIKGVEEAQLVQEQRRTAMWEADDENLLGEFIGHLALIECREYLPPEIQEKLRQLASATIQRAGGQKPDRRRARGQHRDRRSRFTLAAL